MRPFIRKFKLAAVAVLLLVGSNACNELDPVGTFDPITDPSQIFLSLTLNHKAINLSTVEPGNQVQLVATPRNALGEPLSGLPPVTFTSSDTTRVHVTADGLVTARAAGNNLRIIAEIVTPDNIRRVDTATVNVIGTAPRQLATFTIQPEPPAEPVWAIEPALWGGPGRTILNLAGLNLSNALRLRALDQDNLPVTGLQVFYQSLDPEVALIRNPSGTVVAYRPGQVKVTVSTFAYGVALADTVTFTMLLPRVHGVRLEPQPDSTLRLSADNVIVRPGGYVFWFNQSLATPISITFDEPAAASEVPELCAWYGEPLCGSGNIAEFNGETSITVPRMPIAGRARRFDTPGTYTYHTSNGLAGSVTVATEEEMQ